MSRNLTIRAYRKHDNRNVFLSAIDVSDYLMWDDAAALRLDKPTADRVMEMLSPVTRPDHYWTFTVEKAP